MRSRRAIALLLAMAAVLVGLYVCFRPQLPKMPDAATDSAAPATAPNAGSPLRREFALTVAGGKLVSGPAVIQVTQGTQVTLRIRSDRADELHLHGYDLHARIDPGAPAELTFTTDKTGRFEFELHHSHVVLGALEVRPE